MINLKIIGLAMLLIAQIESIIINCKFEDEIIHNWNVRYSCKTQKLIKDNFPKTVSKITGDPINNTTGHSNVTQFLTKGITVENVIYKK